MYRIPHTSLPRHDGTPHMIHWDPAHLTARPSQDAAQVTMGRRTPHCNSQLARHTLRERES